MAAKFDGLGIAVDENADYYVQDNRQIVGNCVLWWGVNGSGYVCELEKAGVYKGSEVVGMRDSDVVWPAALVLASAVRHVRMEPLRRAAHIAREAAKLLEPVVPPATFENMRDALRVVEHPVPKRTTDEVEDDCG